jgi:hypothetical protein
MRVVVAKVLAAAANAVLVAQHHFQLGTHLTSVLARLQIYNLARKSSLECHGGTVNLYQQSYQQSYHKLYQQKYYSQFPLKPIQLYSKIYGTIFYRV